MSPEQARGDKEIRATTDVYAIGAILHELLTGKRLHAGLCQPEILGWLLRPDPAPSPRATRKDLHPDLDTICRKCLEKTPGDRYQNPSELANDLRRYLDHLPILARPTPLWKQGWSRLKRHPVRSALTGMALASVCAGLLAWSVFREQKRRGEVTVLLNDLGSASVARFPEIVPQIDPRDPRVDDHLRSLFVVGKPNQKLAAALVLGRVHPEYQRHSYDQLLQADPREVGAIAGLLRVQMPELASRLATDADTPASPGASAADSEAHDHRRANAANALIGLDPAGEGWKLLRFQANPQARTFLIHQLGSSGVAPRAVFDRLKAERDATIRRSLILALGEMPETSSDDALLAELEKWVLGCYEHDPDPGVHGAAKWLLGRWKVDGPKRAVDARLASSEVDGRGWRIGTPLGLTFVRCEDAKTGRIIEVADTEITVAQILKWRKVSYREDASPGPDHPINGSSYLLSAEFLNWLSREDGIGDDELAYRPGSSDKEPPLMPVEGQLDRRGYRLLADREFELACRAGTTTPRYCGASVALLSRYARYFEPPAEIRSNPVGLLKPNDLGLFDMLGNVSEICQASEKGIDPKVQAVACGGSLIYTEPRIKSDARTGRMLVGYPTGDNDCGFRVAATVQPRGKDRPSSAP